MSTVLSETAANKETSNTNNSCGKVYFPRADIFESQDKIVVITDMPGVSEKNVDITLENNVLTINGYLEQRKFEGYNLAFAEYEKGDYKRAFTLSNTIDREGIEAAFKNGVLTLTLPKSKSSQAKKITVKAQ